MAGLHPGQFLNQGTERHQTRLSTKLSPPCVGNLIVGRGDKIDRSGLNLRHVTLKVSYAFRVRQNQPRANDAFTENNHSHLARQK